MGRHKGVFSNCCSFGYVMDWRGG